MRTRAAGRGSEGEHDGVRWRVEDGLLRIEMEGWKALALASQAADRIKELARNELHCAEDFHLIHRLSRMAHELTADSRVTNMDKKDVACLYELRHDSSTECLLKVFNETRQLVRATEGSIVTADHFAKSLYAVMTD